MKQTHTKPRFFRTPEAFRTWLGKNHARTDELWVGYYKKSTGRESIDWPQSRDQALCYGWIDGIRKSIDEASFMIRFTPRRPGSIWSAVNIARVKALTTSGHMTDAGLEVFRNRNPRTSERYSFEQANISLPAAYVKIFRSNSAAWKFFSTQPPSYQKLTVWWVVSAKKENTRMRRLKNLISDSAAGLRITPLRRADRKRR